VGLAVFDICDTLYSVNTTVDFLRFFGARNDPAVAARVARWTGRGHPAFWLGALSHRLLGKDIAKARMIAALAGHDRALIDAEANAYASQRLPALSNAEVMQRLERHRANGDDILLLSSSISPVAEAIGRALRVEAQGSLLGFDGGRCTGRIATDLTSRKSEYLAQSGAPIERPLSVYTDNRTDRALIALADRATIVLPKGSEARWAGDDHDYIAL
jgi:phosphoserine phosphatase